MGMFSASPRESYDALYSVLNQPADTSALEREQAPGVFAGGMGTALGTGAYRGWSRGASILGNVATPALRPIAKSIDELFGTKTDDWLIGEQDKANRALFDSKLDPKTYGSAAQMLYGVSDVLTTVVTTGGNPYAMAGVYGISQAGIGMQEGLDPITATVKGGIEGAAMGVSVALPASITGSLALRMASGGAFNAAVGIPERALVSSWLNARGYPEMARQYAPFDATALATELVLGAAFGGLLGPRAKAKLPPPEAVPPSAVDAALTANQATHAEIHSAPGVPTDTRSRQAHVAALDQAVEALVMGREVNVEALLRDAGFVGKRPDFDALKVIADELERAGAKDVVAQVRAIEAEAKARGLYVEPDALGSVVLSDKPVESRVAGTAGRESQVRIGEDYVPTRLVLVEATDVAATMTKADNQFRDRTRVASEQQIQDIASRLDAHLLMDAPVMDYGAPVLAADGTVIGGNGRAAAVNRAYEIGTAQAYRDALRGEFGDAVDGMQRPMLVRVLQREVDVPKAAILSNEGQALRMSALEQAKVDAERLGDFRTFEFNEDGAVDLAANMSFIRAWAAEMPAGQRAAIMDADGRLSAEGAKRLQNAILFKAYGDSPTLARLVEATDPGSRNIAAALTRTAPAVADAREAIERGDLYPLGLHDDLIAAVEKLEGLRRDGMPVDTWLKQIDAFGDGMTAEARLLVEFMDRNIRASRVISEGIFGFYNRLLEAGNPKQGSMFEAAEPVKGRMLEEALGGEAPMYSRGAQTDTPEFRAWFGDSKVVDAEGKPLVVYHGTDAEFDAFSPTAVNAGGRNSRLLGDGFYFTTDPKQAAKYGKRVIPVYLRLVNPRTQGADGMLGPRSDNQDGTIAVGTPGTRVGERVFVVKSPTQIKSATGNRGTFDPTNPDIRMSRGATRTPETVETLTTAFRAMFGRDADRLMETGRVRVVQSVANLPGSGHPADVGGMFWRGEAWVVADNTGLSKIRGRVLHEVGEHAGMQQMLGDALYQQVLDTVARKAETDPVFREARALAEARANRPEHVPAETLAYLIENAPELPVVRRILAAVRQWLYRTTGGRFVDLTQADLQMMAVASLRRYARDAEVAAKGEDAPWYMTLFHGSPTAFKPEPGAPLGRLRWQYINTGEGAQAFGYGHYLAQQEWIARTRYRDRLAERKAKQARIEIPYPGDPTATFVIDDSTGPGFRVGDQIVHPNMPGELGGIGWAIREIKSTGDVEQVRAWATRDRADERVKLETYQRGNMNEGSLNRIREWIAYYEAALRALDDLTVNGKLRPDIEEVRPEPPKGALYGKFIPDEQWQQMMIWDAPLDKQPEGVRAAFDKLGWAIFDGMGMRGEEVYKRLADQVRVRHQMNPEFNAMVDSALAEIAARRGGGEAVDTRSGSGSEEVASVMLYQAGIPGHRFLDGETRAAGWDAPDARFNVVLYSDDLGRVAWEARAGDKEWVTANGRASVKLVNEDGAEYWVATVDGKQLEMLPRLSNMTLDNVLKQAEQALDGGLYARTEDGDKIAPPDPLEDTTLPDARALSAQADAEIATATELSQGFGPAVDCFLRVGE